jgi:quinoprotein glucose dehydrogenase
MMDNRVIGLMPSNKLVALNAVTGKQLWEFAPIHLPFLTGRRE